MAAGGGLAALVSLTAAGPAAAASVNATSLTDDFSGYPISKSYPDGASFGIWQTRFAGYGTVSVERADAPRLRLAPAAATSPGATHAALVVSKNRFTQKCQTVEATIKTVRQLRTGSAANPWETAWLVWDYSDDAHFTYLALKPNGWELGKRDPAYPGGQRFLATGNAPAYPIGVWNTVKIKRVNAAGSASAATTVTVDGKQLTVFTDRERPYLAGKIGFYTEDAVADLDSIKVRPC